MGLCTAEMLYKWKYYNYVRVKKQIKPLAKYNIYRYVSYNIF